MSLTWCSKELSLTLAVLGKLPSILREDVSRFLCQVFLGYLQKPQFYFFHCNEIVNVSMDYLIVKSCLNVPRIFKVSVIKKCYWVGEF